MNENDNEESLGDLACPGCGKRRILYPVNQEVNSLQDPKATFIHIKGGLTECG